MFNISAYLEKFRKAGVERFIVKDAFIEAAFSVAHVKIERQALEIRGGVAFVKAHPAIKAHLHLKKQALLKALSEKGAHISDIR